MEEWGFDETADQDESGVTGYEMLRELSQLLRETKGTETARDFEDLFGDKADTVTLECLIDSIDGLMAA